MITMLSVCPANLAFGREEDRARALRARFRQMQARDGAARSLPLKGLSDSHISCRVFGMRKTPTPPLPLWERASGLSAAGSLRPRRLGRKGEGPDLAGSLEDGCLFTRRPVP